MDSLIYQKAYQFAIRVVKAYRHLCAEQKEFVLSKQLLRSGTAIAANISEANGAISRADFRAKMSIAYKESLETQYWLSLLKDTGYIQLKAFDSIYQDAAEVSKMLCKLVKNTQKKNTTHEFSPTINY
jgi:four helix bundle protein